MPRPSNSIQTLLPQPTTATPAWVREQPRGATYTPMGASHGPWSSRTAHPGAPLTIVSRTPCPEVTMPEAQGVKLSQAGPVSSTCPSAAEPTNRLRELCPGMGAGGTPLRSHQPCSLGLSGSPQPPHTTVCSRSRAPGKAHRGCLCTCFPISQDHPHAPGQPGSPLPAAPP